MEQPCGAINRVSVPQFKDNGKEPCLLRLGESSHVVPQRRSTERRSGRDESSARARSRGGVTRRCIVSAPEKGTSITRTWSRCGWRAASRCNRVGRWRNGCRKRGMAGTGQSGICGRVRMLRGTLRKTALDENDEDVMGLRTGGLSYDREVSVVMPGAGRERKWWVGLMQVESWSQRR